MFDKEEEKPVYIGSDHAGFEDKNKLKVYLNEKGYHVTDLGCFTPEPCDYPDIAREVGEKVLEVPGAQGILICGTGIGMSMAANKLRGIRAGVATSVEMAEMTRKHNDANVLAMGSRTTGYDLMPAIADKFLTTKFEVDAERHVRRVEKIENHKNGN